MNPHLTVLLSIGGEAEKSRNFRVVARDPMKCERFARSARDLVVEFGLDGIDVHWDTPTTLIEGQQLLSLLRQIRRHLPSPTYSLTCALSTPTPNHPLQNLPLGPILTLLDQINLYIQPTPGNPTFAARLTLQTALQSLINRNVPLYKLHLAIPPPQNTTSPLQTHTGIPSPASSERTLPDSPSTAGFSPRPRRAAPIPPATQAYADHCAELAAFAMEVGMAGVVVWPGSAVPTVAVESMFGALHGVGKGGPVLGSMVPKKKEADGKSKAAAKGKGKAKARS